MAKSLILNRYASTKSRIVEWSLLLLVIGVLVVVFVRQVRVVQGQMELAAIKSTLGTLRTALVIDHLQKHLAVGRSTVAIVQRNPFELIQGPVANYAGEVTSVQAGDIVPGSWIFDAECGCVAYRPMFAQWLDSPSGDAIAWFRVKGSIGPFELVAKEAYLWQGDVLN